MNLGFNDGAALDDPEGRLEGTGKHIRHLRLAREEDLKQPHVRAFLQAAIRRALDSYGPPPEDEPPRTVVKIYARKRRPEPGS